MSLAEVHSKKIKQMKTDKDQLPKHKIRLNVLKKRREALVKNDGDIFKILDIDNDINREQDIVLKLDQMSESDYLLKVSEVLNSTDVENEFTQNVDLIDMKSFVEQRIVNNKGELFSKYMHTIEGMPPIIRQNDDSFVCKLCSKIMTMCTNESYIVCTYCGEYIVNFEHSATGMTYEQEINTDTNTHFSYKRINHLRELLSQLQAKESSNIPNEILDEIKGEFRKERIQDLGCITQDKVKSVLKKLGYNKFYEHTRQITNILSGKPPPTISNQLYDKIIKMFIEIQVPFEEVCPKNRKNFFSYNYILFKFCELLDQHEHMELFPLLKSREKLYQQDCIWKNICDIKGWPFIKSV
jgi:DNA-directed RNA polymerase subunit RPC12/RpoP